MAAMTLMWTALPAGMRRDEDGAWLGRVSVFLSPRLEVTDGEMPLSAFPAFIDWPKTLRGLGEKGITFRVEAHDGKSVVASVTAAPTIGDDVALDSDAWRAIFNDAIRVAPFDAPADTGRQGSALQTYDAGGVVRAIRDVYGRALAAELDIEAEPLTLAAFEVPATRLVAPGGVEGATPIEQFVRFYQAPEEKRPPVFAGEPEPCPDFHQVVAATGTHPLIMRRLGLVFDLDLPADRLAIDAAGGSLRIRVAPANADFPETMHLSLWTMAAFADATDESYRPFRAAPDRRLGSAGLAAFGADGMTVMQEQLEHATMALIQQARDTQDEEDAGETPAPLPALLQGGMRLAHAAKPALMRRAIGEQARLEQTLMITRERMAAGAPTAEQDEEILYAEHVTRGYRVDVQDYDTGPWRSLCRRSVGYHAGGWSWPPADAAFDDEGVIEPTAFTDPRDPMADLHASEDLFEWDGWSLVVPRPERAGAKEEEPAAGCGPSLTVDLTVPPGSLQPQRFGRCYRFRLRNVDLAGNSLSVAEAGGLTTENSEHVVVSDPVCCLRVESAKPPVVFRAQPRGPGEAGDVVVLRDAESHEYRTREFRLHVLPPEVSVRIAEKHGVFDGLRGPESWRLIAAHRGDLARDENGEVREAITDREVFTPYLPDPIVRQATLSLPDDGGVVDMPRFDDLPPHARGHELARSCQLVVRSGRDRVRARVVGRQVIVEVPKGRVQTVHIAAKLDADDVALLAVGHADWHGTDDPAMGAMKKSLVDAAARGAAPLVAPSRPLTIIHATQRPLTAPAFGRPLILPRQPQSTGAILADNSLRFDRPSTGRIDVYAAWEDLVDDPAQDGWRTVSGALYAGGVRIGEDDGKPFDPLELAESPRSPLAHDFGDTRHRLVRYRAQATSRFVEFYPQSLTADPDNVTLRSEPVTLRLPSTAPPAAPDIAFVIPTFGVSETRGDTGHPDSERTTERGGDGLRIYMNRGWFSSGADERLALVVATSPDPPEALKAVVSEWGANPLRNAAPLPGALQFEHVWGGAERISGWPVDGGTVGLVVHDVGFSKEHGLPFVDVAFLAQRAFMPLVRLALARYQEHAIENCRLSSIIHADFVPLAPGRALTIRKVADATWSLTMRGYSYIGQKPNSAMDRTSVARAHIEFMLDDAPDDPAGWRPLGEPIYLQAEALEPWRYHWKGTMRIDDPRYLSRLYRRRIVVEEFEPFESAGGSNMSIEERSRLVSANAIPI